MEKKIAVVFPGVGYHADRPLLYYSGKIAVQYGFEILKVPPYQDYPTGIRGNPEKMRDTLKQALLQCEDFLKERNLKEYGTVLFLSKSIGTAVASAYAGNHQLTTRNVFFTPVEETFPLIRQDGIIFHGTRDPWLEEQIFLSECARTDCPYYLVEGANHSLETGDTRKDLDHLRWIMEIVEEYIRKSASGT